MAASSLAPSTALAVLLASLASLLCLLAARRLLSSPGGARPPGARRGKASVLALLGSGGHTAEMLVLLAALPPRFSPVH